MHGVVAPVVAGVYASFFCVTQLVHNEFFVAFAVRALLTFPSAETAGHVVIAGRAVRAVTVGAVAVSAMAVSDVLVCSAVGSAAVCGCSCFYAPWRNVVTVVVCSTTFFAESVLV